MLAAPLCKQNSGLSVSVNKRRGCLGQPMTLLQQQSSHALSSRQCLHIIWMSGCYFWKGLVVHLRLCGIFFIFYLSETQTGSKEECLTLWCHQPHPNQSLNPQTVIEFEDQEAGSSWIFQKHFEFGGSKTQL